MKKYGGQIPTKYYKKKGIKEQSNIPTDNESMLKTQDPKICKINLQSKLRDVKKIMQDMKE